MTPARKGATPARQRAGDEREIKGFGVSILGFVVLMFCEEKLRRWVGFLAYQVNRQ